MKYYKILLVSIIALFVLNSCNVDTQQTSDSGLSKASVHGLSVDANGNSIEQANIIERLKRDNLPGSIKHLYIISAQTGDVLQYSTVKGKVTSGNKRLSPKTVYGNYVKLGDKTYSTDEVLDDGGAYGDSGNYMFWFDAQGNYQQYYPAGGTYVQISDKPLRIRRANLTLTLDDNTGPITTALTKTEVNPDPVLLGGKMPLKVDPMKGK